MKRKAIVTILSLVMCLSVAFPASAAAYPVISLNATSKSRFTEAYNAIWGINTALSAAILEEYPYVGMLLAKDGSNYVVVGIRSKVKNPANGSAVWLYRRNSNGVLANGATTHSFAYTASAITSFTGVSGYDAYYFLPEFSTVDTPFPVASFRSISGYDFPDLSALQSLLEQAKSLQNASYTQSSWNVLQSQISVAENVIATTSIMQAQTLVNDTVVSLQAALDGLVLLIDTSSLAALLLEADAIEDIGYTEESWKRFINARNAAHALLLSGDYTQSQYNAVYAELLAAMNGLSIKVVTPPEPPSPPAAPLGYDLSTGDISGYLNVMPKITYAYIDTIKPILWGIFGIIISILIIPRVFAVIIPHLRR